MPPRKKVEETPVLESLSADNMTDIYAELMKGTQAHMVSDTSKGVLHDRVKIPTPIPQLNCIFGGGIPLGVIVEMFGNPSCLVGSTKIMTLDGKTHTLEELYDCQIKDIGIYGCNTDKSDIGKLSAGLAEEAYLAKYVKDLIELEIDEKYTIQCTEDHPFLLRDGTYKHAGDLKPFDELMPIKRKQYSYDSRYADFREMTIDCDSNYLWTHKLVARDLVPNPDNKAIIHHLDKNPQNNYPDNLVWCTSAEHNRFHGRGQLMIKRGVNTRFKKNDVNRFSEKYKEDSEFADRFRQRCIERESKRRKHRVLSYLNSLLLTTSIQITPDNFKEIANTKKMKLETIAKVYDCLTEDNKVDLLLLQSKWELILSEASNYNHKITKVTPIHLDKEIPVYGLVNAGRYHNYAIALDEEHGIFVSNSGKSSTSYQMLGEFQKMYPPGKGLAIIVDTEASVDSQRMKFMGCNPEHILRIPAGTLEKGFESLYSILDKKVANPLTKDLPVFILWDTIGVSPTEKEMDSTSEYAQGMMGHGKLIKNQLSKMLPRIEQQPILIVLLNQVYTSMDRYGNSKLVSGGGYGLKHNAHLRIEFKGGKDKGDDEKTPLFITTKLSEINLEKSKISPLFKGIPIVIDVTKGGVVNPIDSMLVFIRDRLDYVYTKGAWTYLNKKLFEWYPEYDYKFDKFNSGGSAFYFKDLEAYVRRRPKMVKFFQLCFLKEISDMYSYQAEICKPYIEQLKKEMEEPEPEKQADGSVIDLWTGQPLSWGNENAKIDEVKNLLENLE